MSAAAKGWNSPALPADAKAQVLGATQSIIQEATASGRAVRKQGLWFGAAGMLIGVLGIGDAVWEHTRPPTPTQFYAVDDTGVHRMVSAPDAPKEVFTSWQIRTAIEDYIVDREQYIPETDDLDFHRVAVKSTQAEQDRYSADHDPHNPKSPGAMYGKTGFVRLVDFIFLPGSDSAYNPDTATYDFKVRFKKVEIKQNMIMPPIPMVAYVKFQFHPELPMSDDDRAINNMGLQVVAYTALPDGAPR